MVTSSSSSSACCVLWNQPLYVIDPQCFHPEHGTITSWYFQCYGEVCVKASRNHLYTVKVEVSHHDDHTLCPIVGKNLPHLSFRNLTDLRSIRSWTTGHLGVGVERASLQVELFGTESQPSFAPALQRLKCAKAANTRQECPTPKTWLVPSSHYSCSHPISVHPSSINPT